MRNYRRLCTHTFYIGELKTVSTTRNRYALMLPSRLCSLIPMTSAISDYLRLNRCPIIIAWLPSIQALRDLLCFLPSSFAADSALTHRLS